VVCAGQLVHPGDVIVGDDDGVVVVPKRTAAALAATAQAREDKEAANRAQLAAGVLGLDIYDMRGKLERAGLRFFENPEDVD
jgi:4-hydroxy-4-methyl-2-oxoglutarate aldolase